MKKDILKVAVISATVGAIVAGSATGVVAYGMGANQVEFTPTDSAWKVNNVNEAIDDLYIKKTGDNYSTEERVIGTWIDGKPLYQKTIVRTGTISSSSIPHQISDVDYIFITEFIYKDNDNIYYINEQLGRGKLSVDKTNVVLSFLTNGWNVNDGIYITLKYTKTTDEVPSQSNKG